MDAVAGPYSGSLLWNIKQAGILQCCLAFIVPLVNTFQSLSFCFCVENDKSQSMKDANLSCRATAAKY